MSQQPQKQLADSLKALAGASAGASADGAKTTPISSSDTKPMNDDSQVSTSSSRMTIEANINQQLAQSAPQPDKHINGGGPEEAATTETRQACASGALDDSARQQDLEFFRRFLQQSEGATSGGGGGSMGELALASKVPGDQQHTRARGTIGEHQGAFASTFAAGAGGAAINKSPVVSSSIMDQLMPQMPPNHSSMHVAPTYPLPLMYSTFGTNFQSGDSSANSSLVSTLNPDLTSASSLAFYGNFANSSSDNNAAADRMFLQGSGNNAGGGGGLLDNYSGAQLMPSEGSLFGNSASRFEFMASGQAAAKTHAGYQRRNEPPLNQSALDRTYSSVLNNPAALVSSSIFDVPRQLSANNEPRPLGSLSSQLSRPLHQQQQQLNSQAARLFGDSPLATIAQHNQHSHQMMGTLYAHPSRGGGQLVAGRHFGSGPPARFSQANERGSAALKRRNKLPPGPFGPHPANSSPLADNQAFRLDTFGCSLAGAGANSNQEGAPNGERFSRKVFVGGLPPDIDEEEIKASFRRFGALVVDWPHKAESKSYFPPKGYAFLLFQEEASVQALIDTCFQEEDKLYLCVSSPTIKDKPVQIRPWRLCDTDFVLDSTLALDPRKTVFVGGVPRPLKACELANIMNNLYGSVCYAGIDTDPELKYPKGAGRVAFSSHQSYIAAISARFVHIQHSEIEKRVEVKPYVLDDQFCDECHGLRCANKFAPFFCANITCLRYYCDHCWSSVHSQAGREFHKPLVKEGGDRPRGSQTFRW